MEYLESCCFGKQTWKTRSKMASTSKESDFTDSEDGCLDEESFELVGENDHYSNIDMNDDLVSNEHRDTGINGDILEPCTGMAFSTLEDARDFYYQYAKRMGFTIRTNRIRHSLKNMAVIGRDFVCSREGFRASKHTLRKDRVLPPRPITREGCKAMIRLAARDGGTWLVTKFEKEHNHKLMSHCKGSGELPIVNILSEGEKDKKIQDLYDELQREKQRSAALRQQLQMIIQGLEEHADFMSIRVEDIVVNLKQIELEDI